jgi:FMN phosphatase YigB (HAD superfamily)
MAAIVLDIGNVLVNLDMMPFVNALSKQFNISELEASEFVRGVQRLQDLGLTTVSHELRHQFNIRSEVLIKDLLKAWDGIVTPNEQSIYGIELLIKSYKLDVAILSNIGPEHIYRFTHSVLGYNKIIWENSIHHFSCDVGMRKPTRIYYHMFLEEHPQFKGAIYLDDLQENLDTGAKLGFKTFKYDLTRLSRQQIDGQLILLDKFINKTLNGDILNVTQITS